MLYLFEYTEDDQVGFLLGSQQDWEFACRGRNRQLVKKTSAIDNASISRHAREAVIPMDNPFNDDSGQDESDLAEIWLEIYEDWQEMKQERLLEEYQNRETPSLYQVKVRNGNLEFWLCGDKHKPQIGTANPLQFDTNPQAWKAAIAWLTGYRLPLEINRIEIVGV